MGKGSIFIRILVLLVILPAMTACNEEEPVHGNYLAPSLVIGPAGGEIEGINGDVVLHIPAGALNEPIGFIIREWPEGDGSGSNELLKTLIIEPFITFNIPAQVTMRTDGCLGCGKAVCDGITAFFYVWNDQLAFSAMGDPCISSCCIESSSHMISGYIGMTGIISTRAEGDPF